MVDLEWKKAPTEIARFPKGIDYVLGIDETGTANHKGVQRRLEKGQEIDANDKHFTLTGVMLDRSNHRVLLDESRQLKNNYWNDGMYDYKGASKMICLHSREIRKREGPFKLDKKKYEDFLNDLTDLIKRQSFMIYSTTIDKEELCVRYATPFHPYQLAAEFLLERYSFVLNNLNKNGIIMLESRGKKEDKFVLKHLIDIIENGNRFKTGSNFDRVKGIYFNSKWSPNKNTYPILEFADLISYPIHKYIRSGFENRDSSFEAIEEKIYSYPLYFGKGLKIFPENRKAATAKLGGRPGSPRSV